MRTNHQYSIPDKASNQSSLYLTERLRQARLSFDLTLSMAVAAALISMGGAVLMFAGKIPAGVVTTAGGVVSSSFWFRLSKDANDRLDKIISELENDESDEEEDS